MKKSIILLGAYAIFIVACGSGNKQNSSSSDTTNAAQPTASAGTGSTTGTASNPSYDPHRGEGKFSNFVAGPFNAALADKGKAIYNTKCISCHKLTGEKLVGPGWKDITKRHSGAWILNFVTNPDAMLDQDPELQKQLEICMVRMPNQNLTDDDAKAVYEFMRQNDGAK